MANRNELLKQVGELRPILQIGKSGLTEGVLDEIKKHLKKRKLIKIKCLRYFVDGLDVAGTNKEKMAFVSNKITSYTDSELIQTRGFTLCLYYGGSNN